MVTQISRFRRDPNADQYLHEGEHGRTSKTAIRVNRLSLRTERRAAAREGTSGAPPSASSGPLERGSPVERVVERSGHLLRTLTRLGQFGSQTATFSWSASLE